ncbi:MAG: porin family protein [Ignavibacteria bacterium]|nr:porin family protein [Ignavibacteria bacterium]
MKKTSYFLAIIFLISYTSAQSIRIGPTVGYTFPNSQDLDIQSVIDKSLEFDGDMHFGAKLKIGLPMLPVTITGGFQYAKLSGSFNNLSTEQTIYVVSAGGEFAFIPGPIQPYGALDLMYTSFGEFKTSNLSLSESNGRFGIGFGAGVDIKILPMVDLDLSVKYALHNLIGKEDGEESFNTANVSLSVLFNVL